jgi:membrane associated rhomboid family serine protease
VLIPLRHESMRGRRWPVVTFTLIGLNVLIFLFTNGPIHDQQPQRAQTRVHLVLLAAMHPELQMSPGSAAFVESVKKKAGSEWDTLASPQRAARDNWDSQIRQTEDPAELQQEMTTLCDEFDAQQNSDILDKYAFVPAKPHLISYITANFLHGGWIHLIGNMWFLWLAGFILEDNWGRVLYSIFYLVAGAAALQFYAWCAAGSYMPLVGASGAVAALMGAFLVRFPKMKIEMAFFGLFFRFRFKAAAYWLLPLWLVMEFFYGSVMGVSSPVAHWAHVGGFLFGMVGAYGLMKSGLEQKASEAIESKVGWSADSDIVRAGEAMEKSNYDKAANILQDHLKRKPATLDALQMLQQVQWRRSDMPAYLEATAQLCQWHLKAPDADAAWRTFEEYTSAGGEKLPPATWLEIARLLETQQHFDRAATEYQRLAAAHPAEKQSILALVAAGRLCLKRLNRPDEALECYERAAASQVPHLDWQPNIDSGIRDAKAAQVGSLTTKR